MRQALLFACCLLLSACGLFVREQREPLPPEFTMQSLREGYPLAMQKASQWSQQVHLESVTGIYERQNSEWRLRYSKYVFVDPTQKKYVSVTIDLVHRYLEVFPPGKVGGKGSIVTTGHFELERVPIDEQKALALAEAHLISKESCQPREVNLSGHGELGQIWWVDFYSPFYKSLSFSPLFLATFFVDAETGEVRLYQDNVQEICPP